jgi:hypothetical protein
MDNNPFNMRRFSNIFNPPDDDPLMGAYRKLKFNEPSTAPGRAPSGPTSAEADNDPLSIAIKRLQGGQAANAYREHISKMPTMEAYAPSKTRRFGGALAAAAASFNDPKMGAAIGEKIIDAPYRGALESWQMKGAGLKEQADIEQDDVKGQIEYIKMIRDQQKNQRDYDLNVRKVDIDEEQANTNRLYRQAQIDNFKNQGFREMTDPEGNLILFHPDGRTQNMGPSIEGRKVANQERGTNISAYNAETSRGQLGVSQGNLGIRGQEFGQRQAQDAIQNAARDRQLDISQQSADQSGMNAGSAGFVNAGEVFTANAMAAQEVARSNPKFKDWTLDDQGRPARPGTLWGTNPVDPADPEAREFLQAVEAAKNTILRTRRPGVGAPPRGNVTPPGPIKFGDLPTGGGGGGLKF